MIQVWVVTLESFLGTSGHGDTCIDVDSQWWTHKYFLSVGWVIHSVWYWHCVYMWVQSQQKVKTFTPTDHVNEQAWVSTAKSCHCYFRLASRSVLKSHISQCREWLHERDTTLFKSSCHWLTYYIVYMIPPTLTVYIENLPIICESAPAIPKNQWHSLTMWRSFTVWHFQVQHYTVYSWSRYIPSQTPPSCL